MKDNLESFIEANRGGFDDLEPKGDLWARIEEDLESEQHVKVMSPPKKNWVWKISVAASIVLAFCVGLLVRPTIDNEIEDRKGDAIVELEVHNPMQELIEVENYYAQIIEEKKSNIQLILSKNDMMDQEMLEDLDDLDGHYDLLKNQLDKNQNNERVINAMVQNLQLRVEILNKQLMILEQLSNQEENEEVISI